MSITTDAKPQFQKAIDHLNQELKSIRTGRATPALVEDVKVEAYGSEQPLKSLASISTPDARTVQIEPWDAGVVKSIETAIMESNIGINPTVDGKTIRLNMPMMTEEMRITRVKGMKTKIEEAKVSIRRVREDLKKQIEGQEGESEDVIRDQVAELEDVVKARIAEIDELGKKKEEEIMTI
jgi:ribosome recycling factor